ncbi:hypothetical protein D3C83_243360 [compost metagenome]
MNRMPAMPLADCTVAVASKPKASTRMRPAAAETPCRDFCRNANMAPYRPA